MKYLASFVRKSLYQDFCLPELISICEMYKIPFKHDINFSYDINTEPVLYIEIPEIEEVAQKICERAVLTKNIIKIYSEGKTFEELISKINVEEFKSESQSLESFKFDVDARGRVISQEEKVEVIEMFDGFNFKAKIEMKNPKRVFVVIDNHYRGMKYFGRLIGGKSTEDPQFYSKYNLNTRRYLGPTSTDNVLGFIMCNLGQVKPFDNILDPFVGTGSLLIPPSHYKAVTVGCDIDMRVLKGHGIGYTRATKKNQKVTRESDIFTNFINYNLPMPQILRADINHPCMRFSEFFDSVICDPPYGFRAFSRSTGMEDNKKVKREKRLRAKYGKLLHEEDKIEANDEINENSIEEIKVETLTQDISDKIDLKFNQDDFNDETYFFAPLKQCSIEHIFEKLLILGNSTVKKGGYLVCLFPTKKNEDEEFWSFPINFPQNPNFKLIHAMENAYCSFKSRWCLVYKKK